MKDLKGLGEPSLKYTPQNDPIGKSIEEKSILISTGFVDLVSIASVLERTSSIYQIYRQLQEKS